MAVVRRVKHPSAEETKRSLIASFNDLLEIGALRSTQGVTLKKAGARRQVLRVPGGEGLSLRSDQEFSNSALEYLELLDARAYNALFSDFAFCQIEVTFEASSIVDYRYTYYPCPVYSQTLAEFESEPYEFLSAVTSAEELQYVKLRSPLRFEYSPRDAREYHPSSHLHAVDPAFRIGVAKVLSVRSFLRFLLEGFYSGTWDAVSKHWDHFPKDASAFLEAADRKRLYIDGEF